MRLLFDQNLSHKLVNRLADIFPGSIHVRDIGMKSAADPAIATYALVHGLTIVQQRCGFPGVTFCALW